MSLQISSFKLHPALWGTFTKKVVPEKEGKFSLRPYNFIICRNIRMHISTF